MSVAKRVGGEGGPLEPPESVQVGPFTYTLEFDQTALDREAHRREESLAGIARHAEQRIIVDPDQHGDGAREVVLHEVLHCVNVVTGQKGRMDHDEEERLVNAMSPTLLDTLRRNPRLVAWLMSSGS